MTKITKKKNGNYLLTSNIAEDTFKFDEDIGAYLARNIEKVRYHSQDNLWLYKNNRGKETTLARHLYITQKAKNGGDRYVGKVAFKNGNRTDMRRENLTTVLGMTRV